LAYTTRLAAVSAAASVKDSRRYDVTQMGGAQALLVVFAALAAARLPPSAPAAARRLLGFVAALGAVNWITQQVYLAAGRSVDYYFYKYSMAPVVLLALALPPALAELLFDARAHPARRAAALLAAMLTVGVTTQAEAVYRPVLQVRARGGVSGGELLPFYDPSADALISSTLAATHKTFGGLFHDFFPLFLFMNAEHGMLDGWSYPDYLSRQSFFQEAPGRCYFWSEPAPSLPVSEQIRRLRNAGPATCIRYRQAFRPEHPATLCHVCL
jgi:hypothetical protein